MPRASAPGSVFLFGEHAVVYGRPALVASIDRVVEVSAEPKEGKVLNITSDLGHLSTKIPIPPTRGRLQYVVEAVRQVFEYAGRERGIDIKIKSQLPAASGLGTSSAVCAATVGAVSRAMGLELSKEEMVELSFKTELAVQGLASRAGVSAAVHGGFLKLEERKAERAEGGRLRAVAGWSGIPSSTKRLVEKVRRLREQRGELVDSIFDFIGEIARQGVQCLSERDLRKMGILMDLNHSLLSSLKIVPTRIERMVAAAREAGAYGAKITGAGGGGCMLALVGGSESRVIKAVQSVGADAFPVRLGGRGLQLA
jgi:mevalonate kinase